MRVAVESECRAVATTPEGSRNHRLNQAAFSLGTLVGAQVLDAEDARARLLDAALAAGLDERESFRTIASGLSAGERQPRQMTAVAAPEGGGAGRRTSADPSARPADAATAAVLARVRHDNKPKRVPPGPPSPQRGISR